MKKVSFFIAVLSLSTCLWACNANQEAVAPTSAVSVPETAAVETSGVTAAESVSGENDILLPDPAGSVPEGVEYQNIYFDYSSEIAAYGAKDTAFTMPQSPVAALTAEDQNRATGVILVPSVQADCANDYYLNAYVAGNELTFRGDIKSAVHQNGSGEAEELVVKDGSVTVVPGAIQADEPVDEMIVITLSDNSEYRIHTVHELMAGMDIVNNGKADPGVYTFAVDKFLLRVNTAGEIIYYRNAGCIAEGMVENFKAQDTADGRFYSYFVELKPEWRNANGGFSSGMYVVMDQEYREIDYVTLKANEDVNHTHGEGYLDQHEFVMLGKAHWLSLSYNPVKVENIPEGGIDGGKTGYVHAGIIQEVQDGKVVSEINTTDYELFYGSALECSDYENSTDQASADDVKDYVHVNSVAVDPKDGNLIVSMRHQYAVYKFDRETGEILWILGGTKNQFGGLEDVTDEKGNLFIGQHDAQYVDAAVAGNDSTITVFDNHTNFQNNDTRTIEFVLDEEKLMAAATVIQGSALDEKSGKLHWATHCGSIKHDSKDSVLIGWGLHAIFDNDPEMAPKHPVFTDYQPETDEIAFELNVSRNPLIESHEACFSYRTYKNRE